MKGSAPNWLLAGSHCWLVTKLKPNWRIDRIDFAASATIMLLTVIRMSKAAANIRVRKNASPALPVGDKAVRQRLSGVIFSDATDTSSKRDNDPDFKGARHHPVSPSSLLV